MYGSGFLLWNLGELKISQSSVKLDPQRTRSALTWKECEVTCPRSWLRWLNFMDGGTCLRVGQSYLPPEPAFFQCYISLVKQVPSLPLPASRYHHRLCHLHEHPVLPLPPPLPPQTLSSLHLRSHGSCCAGLVSWSEKMIISYFGRWPSLHLRSPLSFLFVILSKLHQLK